MPRNRPPPATALAAAISARGKGARVTEDGEIKDARFLDLAWLAGCDLSTLSRINRGSVPNLATAEKLASWLGWSVEEVIAAARTSTATEPS